MASSTGVSYTTEISSMMFGFGDHQNPNPDTVKLVESIVLQQLHDTLYEASVNANRRNVKTIEPEDLIFLLRHDRHKMQRFIRYLEYRNVELTAITKFETDRAEPNPKKYKMWKNIRNFVENIDEIGDLLDMDEFDTVKTERSIRAERISDAMDERKYMEYANARQVSFSSRKYRKNDFSLWVDPQQKLALGPTTIEILELLAYGIVAHITDMALIVRQDSKRKPNDPLKSLEGSCYNATMFNAPHIPQNQYNLRGDGPSFIGAQLGEPPITKNEIYEVVRRCFMPQVGYTKFTNKSILGKRRLFLY